MKKLIIICLLFIGSSVYAQDMQLLGYDNVGQPIYGYPVKTTQMQNTYNTQYSQNTYTPENKAKNIARQTVTNAATSAIYGNYDASSVVRNTGIQILYSLMGN